MLQADLNTWIGAPESELVLAWGVPAGGYEADDGSKIIEYILDFGNNSGYERRRVQSRFLFFGHHYRDGWRTQSLSCGI